VRAFVLLGLIGCGGPEDPLIPAATPAAGHVHRKTFATKQAVIAEHPTLGTSLVFYDEPIAKPCTDLSDSQPRYGFHLGLGKVAPTPGLTIRHLGTEPRGPGEDDWKGRRYLNYFEPNPAWAPAKPVVATLGYGGGSYHLVIDRVTEDSISGHIAIGRFNFDSAALSGTFTALRCRR
jgi:hypothetical protein